MSIFAKAAVRAFAKRIALRTPFGVGRTLRDHAAQAERVRQLERRLAELDQRDEVLYWRLVAASMGSSADELWSAATPAERPMSYRALIRRLRRQGRFAERLQAGDPLEDIAVEFVRDRMHDGDEAAARSLSYGLRSNPSTRVAGCLGLAVVADRQHLPELAWACFRDVPPPIWRRLAAREYFRAGFTVERGAAVAAATRIIEDLPPELPPTGWLDLVKAAFGANEVSLAGRVLNVADRLADRAPETWARTTAGREWLRHWLDRTLRPGPPPAAAGDQVSLAILTYKQPDQNRTSTNVGDYVQTLASLGHVARHRNLRFQGEPDLVDLMTELQKRVRTELALESTSRDVLLMSANRDASSVDQVPEGTWLLAFGWYMHAIFERYDFPPNRNLRPIFVSFHCNRPDILSTAGLEYLRTYAPIGCRDWSTVDILLSAGVPAFFTGCLTTTVNTVFPDLTEAERPAVDAPVAYVDVPAPRGAETLRQERAEVRRADLVTNVRNAMDLMETYRRRYSSVITSRLHCYLPAGAVGANVEFRPGNPADIRFNGLIGVPEAAHDEMRRNLLIRLEKVFTAIFAGTGEHDVYALWRDLCAEDVARAMARRASVPPMPPPSLAIPEACARARAGQVVAERTTVRSDGPEIHVATAVDGNLTDRLMVVLEAMTTHTARPLHLWILSSDHAPADHQGLARLFPHVSWTWLSTTDHLLLPDLLPELDRIIYHDIHALPLADIGQLYDWDLQGRPLAARSLVAGRAASSLTNLLRSTKLLRDDPAAAYECVRRMCARHAYDFVGFGAGVLVLDLARMRADRFCQEFLPFAERYGMGVQEILNCYAGPDRAALPPEWSVNPMQEIVADPKIIHWAGPLTPWDHDHVPLRERWTEYELRVRDRERQLG